MIHIEPKIVVFGAPSGVGKNAIVNELSKRYPQIYNRFPSVASRKVRPGESEGNPYIFISDEEFERKIKSGEVFEYTQIHGNYRGMSEQVIRDFSKDGRIIINDVDYIGVLALKKKFNKILSIYLSVPKKEAERRIRSRAGDTEEHIQFRLSNYEQEMESAKHYDHLIENIDIDKCVEQAHTIIIKFFS